MPRKSRFSSPEEKRLHEAEYQREYSKRNPERRKEIALAYYNRNKDGKSRDSQLRYKYGISLEEYDVMFAEQDGACWICQNLCATGQRLSVDHCHDTGVVRGLLCKRCNSAIGMLQEDADLVLRAADYMTRAR